MDDNHIYLEYPDIVHYNNQDYLLDTSEVKLEGNKICDDIFKLYHISRKLNVTPGKMIVVRPL